MTCTATDPFCLISYKHDGSFHRSWQNIYPIPNIEGAYYSPGKGEVKNYDGSVRQTTCPAVFWSEPDRYYNACMFPESFRSLYYINLASPIEINHKSWEISYIDYDIDIIVEHDGSIIIEDEEEFEMNKKLFSYPVSIEEIIKKELDTVLDELQQQSGKFSTQQKIKKLKLL